MSTWRVPRLGLGHCCPTPCRSPSRLRVSRGRRCYPTSLPSPPVLSWTGQGRHPPTKSSSTNRGVSRGQGRKPLSLPCPSIATTPPNPETLGLQATETAANYLSVGLPSTACCAQDGPRVRSEVAPTPHTRPQGSRIGLNVSRPEYIPIAVVWTPATGAGKNHRGSIPTAPTSPPQLPRMQPPGSAFPKAKGFDPQESRGSHHTSARFPFLWWMMMM